MIASVLAHMRRQNVKIELDGEDLTAAGATPAQIEQIRAAKPAIIAALRAEAFTGCQLAENSALFAGIQVTYRAVLDCLEIGCSPKDCMALVDYLDTLVQMPLKEALALYMADMPKLEAWIAQVNDQRRLLLEGRALESAVGHVFAKARSDQLSGKHRERMNANIF